MGIKEPNKGTVSAASPDSQTVAVIWKGKNNGWTWSGPTSTIKQPQLRKMSRGEATKEAEHRSRLLWYPKKLDLASPADWPPGMTTEPSHEDTCEVSNHRACLLSLCNGITGLADKTGVNEVPRAPCRVSAYVQSVVTHQPLDQQEPTFSSQPLRSAGPAGSTARLLQVSRNFSILTGRPAELRTSVMPVNEAPSL